MACLISQVICSSGRKKQGLFESSTEQIREACDPHPSLRVAPSAFRFVTVNYVISAAVKVNCPAPWYFINDLQITAEQKKIGARMPQCVFRLWRVSFLSTALTHRSIPVTNVACQRRNCVCTVCGVGLGKYVLN